MVRRIDINCDMGESYGNFRVGNDEEVMPLITSANVGCGFHGGDPVTIEKTVALAAKYGVGVGSHPSLPDLMGFGRREMKITSEEARAYILYQTGAITAFLKAQRMGIQHVKPHGALYRVLMKSEDLTKAVSEAILDLDKNLYWFMPVPNESAKWARALGVKVVGELYVDMDYSSDGSLIVRRSQFAFEADPIQTVERIMVFLDSGKVKSVDDRDVEVEASSICVHGDTRNAPTYLKAIREELKKNNVEVTNIRNVL